MLVKRVFMLSTSMVLIGTVAWAQTSPQQQRIPTKDEYNAQEIAGKAASIGQLLDEVAKLEAKNKDLEAKLKAAEPKPADPAPIDKK